MNDKRNPLFSGGYFENPPEVIAKDPPAKDPEPPKVFSMKGEDIEFVLNFLRVLNACMLAKRIGMAIPDTELFRRGLSPEKVVQDAEFLADLDLEMLSRHDLYNANIAKRDAVMELLKGSHADSNFPVEAMVREFLPREFSDESKGKAFDLLMGIFTKVADGLIRKENVVADPTDSPRRIRHSTDEF